MFNENDLRFATERHQDMARKADQLRIIKISRSADQGERYGTPLWVRILSAALDRSRWELVPKNEFASRRVAQVE